MNEWLMPTLGAIVWASAAVIPATAQEPPNHSEQVLTLDAEQLDHLQSRMGEGSAVVFGERERNTVEVHAKLHYYDESNIELSLEAHRGMAMLNADFTGGDYSGRAPYMELIMYVPQRFSAELKHGYGDLAVRDLDGMVSIENGAGSILVDNTGGVRVVHQSGGKVQTMNIKGPVRVSQSSGRQQ
ncbi:hypothetical protein ACR0ST_11500 [Aliidiomarina sp. Khilg15.8]